MAQLKSGLIRDESVFFSRSRSVAKSSKEGSLRLRQMREMVYDGRHVGVFWDRLIRMVMVVNVGVVVRVRKVRMKIVMLPGGIEMDFIMSFAAELRHRSRLGSTEVP